MHRAVWIDLSGVSLDKVARPLADATQQPAKPRARIESLADLIFGLALSVGAISLVSNPPVTPGQVVTDIETFGFSFLILITMWLRYTRIMSVFPLDNTRVIRLNIVLLFSVSIEPFLFNIVRNTPSGVAASQLAQYDNTTSLLYALDLGLMFVIMGGFTFTLAQEERHLLPKELMRQYRKSGVGWFICGALFFVSALPIFYDTVVPGGDPVRYYFWTAPLVLIWVLRRSDEREGITSG